MSSAVKARKGRRFKVQDCYRCFGCEIERCPNVCDKCQAILKSFPNGRRVLKEIERLQETT